MLMELFGDLFEQCVGTGAPLAATGGALRVLKFTMPSAKALSILPTILVGLMGCSPGIRG